MKLPNKESTRFVDVVLKSLDILDCFGNEATLNLKQIIDRTGLTRTRAMRLTGTLVSRGYLFFDSELGQYCLGSHIFTLGTAFERNNSIIKIVRPIVKYLVEKTGESSTFYTVQGSERVALVREKGTYAIRYSIQEGQQMPLYDGAGGKVLLAYGPQDLFQYIIDSKQLQPITPNTVIDTDRLKDEIKKIRKQGYAVSLGENSPDARAIAAPVFYHSDHLAGAISIAAPANRLKGKNLKSKIERVLEAAKILSKLLGQTM